MEDPCTLYLDLVMRSVTNYIYGPAEPGFDEQARVNGKDLPHTAQTMVGLKRLEALLEKIKVVLETGVGGDLVEAGVWRGGTSILMRATLKAFGVTDRLVWVADSFEGMPPPDPIQYPVDAGSTLHDIPELAVPLEEVKGHFNRYGLLDSQVRFLKGWFRETLAEAPISNIAVLCLDSGMYESTMNILENLYPKLSPGGFVIMNDYALHGCRKAVEDFRRLHRITASIQPSDWSGAFWQRPMDRQASPGFIAAAHRQESSRAGHNVTLAVQESGDVERFAHGTLQ